MTIFPINFSFNPPKNSYQISFLGCYYNFPPVAYEIMPIFLMIARIRSHSATRPPQTFLSCGCVSVKLVSLSLPTSCFAYRGSVRWSSFPLYPSIQILPMCGTSHATSDPHRPTTSPHITECYSVFFHFYFYKDCRITFHSWLMPYIEEISFRKYTFDKRG